MDKEVIIREIQNSKVREGSLLKQSKFLKQWRQRWVVLTMNFLITFTNKSCKEITDIMEIKAVKSYKSYVSKMQQMNQTSFKLESNDTVFYFSAKNIIQKWSWIVSIQRIIDFKQSGPTHYNSLQAIKNKGFPSYEQYNNPTATIQKQKIKDTEKIKQQLQKQSVQIAKKIFLQQQAIEQQRQKLKKQYKDLYKFRRTLQEQQFKLNSQSFSQSLKQGRFSQVKLTRKAETTHEIMLASKVDQEENYNKKGELITIIFDLLGSDSDQLLGRRYYIDLLINICSDVRLAYQQHIINTCKIHKNNANFTRILVEFLLQYEPITTNQTIDNQSSIYTQEIQYFQNWLKLINLLLSKQQQQINILTADNLQKIAIKIQIFLLHNQSDTIVKLILQIMTKLNSIVKYEKNDIEAKLHQIIKMSTKQEILNLAGNLLANL